MDCSSQNTPDGSEPEPYTFTECSVRVSATCNPHKTAAYARGQLERGAEGVDLVFVGANAGQTAFKVAEVLNNNMEVYFLPRRERCEMPARNPITREPLLNEDGSPKLHMQWAFIWRVQPRKTR